MHMRKLLFLTAFMAISIACVGCTTVDDGTNNTPIESVVPNSPATDGSINTTDNLNGANGTTNGANGTTNGTNGTTNGTNGTNDVTTDNTTSNTSTTTP